MGKGYGVTWVPRKASVDDHASGVDEPDKRKKRTRHVFRKCNSHVNASRRLTNKHMDAFIILNGCV